MERNGTTVNFAVLGVMCLHHSTVVLYYKSQAYMIWHVVYAFWQYTVCTLVLLAR